MSDDARPKKGAAPAAAPPVPAPAFEGRAAFGLAALSALLCWLAYVGVGIWPLAFVCWAPFILAIRGQTPKRAFWLSFFAGTTMIAGGFSWLLGMLQTFSGFPLPLCLLFAVILWSYQGLKYALVGWMTARAEVRGWSPALAFFAAFVATELLYPLLFPYYFGDAFYRTPVLLQTADLGGPILLSVIVVATNLAVVELVMGRLRGAGERRVVYAGAGVLGFALVYGLVRVAMMDAKVAEAEAIDVGIVQGNLGLMQNHTAPAVALSRHRAATADLKKKGAGLVVWSESAVDMAADDRVLSDFYRANVSGGLGVPLIFGTVVFHSPDDAPFAPGRRAREQIFNTALSTDAIGNVTGRYDKEYLLAFGEYLPLGETFPSLYEISRNSGRFTPGTKLDPLPVTTATGKHTVAAFICYEDILPSFTNKLVAATDPELLVNITNDAWFGTTAEPWQHMALAQVRAVEHRRFLVRATNSGVSAVVDPVGRVIASTEVRDVQAGVDAPDTLLAKVRWLKNGTLYGVVGDAPWYGVALLAVVMTWRARRQKDEESRTDTPVKESAPPPSNENAES